MLARARSVPLSSFGKVLTTSPRWADIAVGSDDDLSDVEFFCTLPTVLEDSYRSKPDSALEDSKTGVNAMMRALTPHNPKVHDDGSPKDFGFLLQGAKPTPLDLDDSEDREFGQNLDKLMTEAQAKVPRSKMNKRRKQTGTHSLQRKRGRVSPNGAAPGTPKTRCISDSMSEKSDPAAEEIDSLESASVGGCSISTLDQRFEMPEATEEEWQRRIELRIKAIDLGKTTVSYQRFCAAVPEDQRGLISCVIQTPDAFDRTTSKRKWKDIVNEWRKQLWQHFGDDAPLAERRKSEDSIEDASKTEQGEPEGV